MVKQKDLLRSINQALVDKFPNHTIYINTCPKDFDRPSFLLELIRTSQIDVCRNTVEKTAYFTITCFIEVDNRYLSNAEDLIDMQEDTLKLFEQGYIPVGDRAIKVKGSTGEIDTDRAYIDLQFEYFDDRTDADDNIPMIKSVSTKI